jgi:creatinine amidohydrolase
MRLEDLTWMDVNHYLEQNDRIILVTGATEQHAYLSLLTDILIPSRFALAIAEREQVIITPPLNFGYSRYFANFPGTISLTRATFERVLLEVVECLLNQGFRRFFILNGHGGNTMPERLAEFKGEEEIRIVWYDWWRSEGVKAFENHYNLSVGHANWGENFPFCRVGDVPAGSKDEIPFSTEEEIYANRQQIGDGSFGGPYQIDDQRMQDLFATVVEDACRVLREM